MRWGRTTEERDMRRKIWWMAREARLAKWRPTFLWFPAQDGDGRWRWLEQVWRRDLWSESGLFGWGFWPEYRWTAPKEE